MKKLALMLSACWTIPAAAEVKSVSPNHFEVESRAVVPASPAQVYAMLGRPGEWWNKEHTYSGDPANLSLDLLAGGCFCEKMPADGGTVEHLRIVYAQPGQALRGQGGIGPLQAEAVAGTLTWTLKASGAGTEIVQSYVVAGRVRGGMEQLAPVVDRVLAEQLSGLAKRLAR